MVVRRTSHSEVQPDDGAGRWPRIGHGDWHAAVGTSRLTVGRIACATCPPAPSGRSGHEACAGRRPAECLLLVRGEGAALHAGGGEVGRADCPDLQEVGVAGRTAVRKYFERHVGTVTCVPGEANGVRL